MKAFVMQASNRAKAIFALIVATVIFIMGTVGYGAAGEGQVFEDVSPTKDAWCYSQVMKAYNMGLIKGYGNGYFGKNDPITREQIVQILYNCFGSDCGSNTGFSDVASSRWSAKAVTWAVQNGIVSGYSNGTFGPTNRLTREQLVKILYNVNKITGHPADSGDVATVLAPFTDRTKVAAYAVDGFAWAVSNGIVSGTSATTLSPQGTATRAQVAVILIRYIEKSGDKVPVPEPQPEPQPTPTLEPKNADGTTNADYVNSISNHGKSNDYPTSGAANTANENGYFTKADVDIENATLQYDALEFLNAFLAENGKDPAMWTTSDEVEEYTMMRAKEAYVNFAHTRPDGGYNLTGENLYKGYGNASSVINAWDGSSSHHGTMIATSGNYVCIAKYGTCWVLTGWKVNGNGLDYVVKFAENNYSWE